MTGVHMKRAEADETGKRERTGKSLEGQSVECPLDPLNKGVGKRASKFLNQWVACLDLCCGKILLWSREKRWYIMRKDG